jgi:hypothetical protein
MLDPASVEPVRSLLNECEILADLSKNKYSTLGNLTLGRLALYIDKD